VLTLIAFSRRLRVSADSARGRRPAHGSPTARLGV